MVDMPRKPRQGGVSGRAWRYLYPFSGPFPGNCLNTTGLGSTCVGTVSPIHHWGQSDPEPERQREGAWVAGRHLAGWGRLVLLPSVPRKDLASGGDAVSS